ncbi:group II intron reverse transcriptase/maturase, partial [Tamlana crocina]|nr:group II intron reverse transcriptase/maturase [Tamlana crocina]
MSTYQNIKKEITKLSLKKRNELSSRERVRLLQLKLYLKAKQEKEFKFYVLYDKIFLQHILKEAYRRCKAKGGIAGIDNQRFTDVETYGSEKFLNELQEELRTRKYKPQAVKRVLLEKENGGKRPIGIPT